MGTLGSGNHFIEVCLDEDDHVWFMLHSGSRGVGNRIGSYFIERAREEMRRLDVNLPDRDLAYLREGTQGFDEYVEAVEWAQRYAAVNRRSMMASVVAAVASTPGVPPFETTAEVVDCHHNYVAREVHFGEDVLVTRKGAVRAAEGDLGIIPGSMGARSYIVRGKGNPESFTSCSHGAGRAMSRTRGQAPLHVARPRGGDGGGRMPEGRGRDRRDPRGLQVDRRGDGRAEGPRRRRPSAPAGRLREGMTSLALG